MLLKHTRTAKTKSRLIVMPSRNRVITAASPRMATQQTANGEIQSAQRAVLAKRLNGILRTCGREAARRRQKRRNMAPVKRMGATSRAVKKFFIPYSFFGNAVEQQSDALTHLLRIHRLFGQPDKPEVKSDSGGQGLYQQMFVKTISLTHLALGPITVHRMMQTAFCHAQEHFHNRSVPVRNTAEYGTDGIGRSRLTAGREKRLDVTAQAQVLRFRKGKLLHAYMTLRVVCLPVFFLCHSKVLTTPLQMV